MVCFGVSSGFKSLMLDDIFEKLALQIFWLLSKVGQFFIQTSGHPGHTLLALLALLKAAPRHSA
jgi:hypothetical protein